MADSFFEISARERLQGLVDEGSFTEWLPPQARVSSPHMPLLDQPVAFDDGVVIGKALLNGQPVYLAAQEGDFLGGAVGEVHGAKITAMIRKAMIDKPAAVLLVFESGGVRLHEANAGLVAVSEIMRALLQARAAGIRFIGLVGGAAGCFGGTGLISRCCDTLIMSEEGRLSMSGPEVIETVHGVEEFDSRDRALVWRVTGGKSRYILGEVDALVADQVAAFRQAAIAALQQGKPAGLTLQDIEAEHAMLTRRLATFEQCNDGAEIWQQLVMGDINTLAMMPAAEFAAQFAKARDKAMGGV
ncbi:biotin-independent malonate decarboxylase subunit beta [Limnobacter sp.]|uniref:biotin-independent malonate decarboxylase subunit beta n=1 Tax=Limnobacter sp. TaxID=2003368 RepID=UPI002587AF17|nr:biotin-independent malonate decarboxylase subunit beta [Limnobacter sp.]